MTPSKVLTRLCITSNMLILVIGNEEDFVIISIVRSEGIGFLKEARRVNVMLTRCKMGMIVLTSRTFLTGKASSSLVAGLAKELGPEAWVESKWILYGNFKPFC